ncbi:MAG: ATP-dependent RecD-like DNA helicase [Firmicutes bacterium ADurb.Bin262]|nr:MAG: ATP-dependent RecD-like DNA helicase [Firmicutes bacterium ADurb.Bin262]
MADEQTSDTLRGSVESVAFRNEESGFTVLHIATDEELVTVVGCLPGVFAGENIEVSGTWGYHESYGRQFNAASYVRGMPASAADMLKYLSSGAVKGVGPVTAGRIVEMFGADTFKVIEEEPDKLARVKGISRFGAQQISAEFKRQHALRDIMIALERYSMSPVECLNAYKVFGEEAVKIIETNPYLLCSERIGIGFERADAIAAALAQPPPPACRIEAGIEHVIRHNVGNGHTCIPRAKLAAPCCSLLDVGEEEIEQSIDTMLEKGRLITHPLGGRDHIFLPPLYWKERNIAALLRRILQYPPASQPASEKEIDKIEKKLGVQYEEKQRSAIETALAKGLLILTGGPGTGKTTTVQAILDLYEARGIDYALAAPTGRAAKRMSELTGRPAKTIHRLLEVEWGENDKPVFMRNASNPISANALVIDELSMVDIFLFESILNALPMGCRLIMVGDSDQLPPVGAGNVLKDIIDSRMLPVVELKEIFRQAKESLIVVNAHKIVEGGMPVLDLRDRDFFFIETRDIPSALRTVCDLFSKRLPDAFGYSTMTDIQVLCPSKKGEIGTVALNAVLQKLVNPPAKDKNEIALKNRVLREGDKVMQIKNNYQVTWEKDGESGAGVFNGDIGRLVKISHAGQTLTVDFDERMAILPFDHAVELEHAYAVTVHKSQGNEFEAVVMPVIGAPDLLYTAVTRAKKLMIVVGRADKIKAMVDNDKKVKRYSALKYFLTE